MLKKKEREEEEEEGGKKLQWKPRGRTDFPLQIAEGGRKGRGERGKEELLVLLISF